MAQAPGRPLITLLTDFGRADGYAAAMTGVILREAPQARVIDLSHDVAPFDIQSASYVLATAAFEFPAGTIHVAVVDPSVGSRRRLLIAESEGQRFVLPDNGLLDVPRLRRRAWRWWQVTRLPRLSHPAAPTFHGRDILAPVAAALARGLPPARFGRQLTEVPLRLGLAPAAQRDGALRGRVLHVDRFGTLITTIDAAALRRLAQGRAVRVRVGRRVVSRFVRTYTQAPRGALVALLGSAGWLEVSVVEGSAQQVLHTRRHDPVMVTRR